MARPLTIAAIGAGLLVIGDRAPLPEISQSHTVASEATEIPTPPSLGSLVARYDRSHIPAPSAPVIATEPSAPPVAPPDPAVALRQFQLIGIIDVDGAPLVIAKDARSTQSLRVGENLAGFIFIGTQNREALFEQDGQTVRLSLPDVPSP